MVTVWICTAAPSPILASRYYAKCPQRFHTVPLYLPAMSMVNFRKRALPMREFSNVTVPSIGCNANHPLAMRIFGELMRSSLRLMQVLAA